MHQPNFAAPLHPPDLEVNYHALFADPPDIVLLFDVDNIVTGVLGGRIEVASDAGGGTTFTLLLPAMGPLPGEHQEWLQHGVQAR